MRPKRANNFFWHSAIVIMIMITIIIIIVIVIVIVIAACYLFVLVHRVELHMLRVELLEVPEVLVGPEPLLARLLLGHPVFP